MYCKLRGNLDGLSFDVLCVLHLKIRKLLCDFGDSRPYHLRNTKRRLYVLQNMQISYILTLKSDLDVDTISIILAKGGVADSYSLMTFGTENVPMS